MSHPLPIAVLISGAGSSLKNLIERREAGQVPVDFRLVISSHPTAGGLAFAQEAGIETAVLEKPAGMAEEAYSQQVFSACRRAGAELVVMAGFIKLVLIPDDFLGRVMNIHPALIPAFCGQGYYGQRVHAAVLDYGCKISGCTVHFVDNQYDHGPIILQRVVGVIEEDTVESLAHRVQAVEREALPEAISLFAAKRIRLDGRKVWIANQA
jgi:phosphoribosylglycinamide formyltransferase 1